MQKGRFWFKDDCEYGSILDKEVDLEYLLYNVRKVPNVLKLVYNVGKELELHISVY